MADRAALGRAVTRAKTVLPHWWRGSSLYSSHQAASCDHDGLVSGAVLYGETVPPNGTPKLPFWIQNARVLNEQNKMPEDLPAGSIARGSHAISHWSTANQDFQSLDQHERVLPHTLHVGLGCRDRPAECNIRHPDRAKHCPICRRGFQSSGSLKRHMNEHRPPRRCRNCGKQLRDDEYHSC